VLLEATDERTDEDTDDDEELERTDELLAEDTTTGFNDKK
jgi:hypothetical protein